MKHTILITGGGGVTGRAVARSIRLSREFRDSELIACDIFANKFGIFEGLFDRYIRMSHVDESEYESTFLEAVKEFTPDAILIMTEKEALFWSQLKHKLPTLISPKRFSEIAVEKSKLYETLGGSGLVPAFHIYDRESEDIGQIIKNKFTNAPVWLRCYDIGSTSGKGAYMAEKVEDANAWLTINKEITKFMISEVLPGRNFACNLLFLNGKLLQYAIYERLEYFMKNVSPSGITGNICVGKLVNDDDVLRNSISAIRLIEQASQTNANGLYTVDLKGDEYGNPMITEINLRHTAATGSFAQAGWNMAEFHVLATIGRASEIPSKPFQFPKDNRLLRDIDGIPIYVEEFQKTLSDNLIDRSGAPRKQI